jgi:hypothetical protein
MLHLSLKQQHKSICVDYYLFDFPEIVSNESFLPIFMPLEVPSDMDSALATLADCGNWYISKPKTERG